MIARPFCLPDAAAFFLLLGERLEFSPCVREAPLPPEDENSLDDDEFWDDEDAWMKQDAPFSGEDSGANEHDDRGMQDMHLGSWAIEPGEEEC